MARFKLTAKNREPEFFRLLSRAQARGFALGTIAANWPIRIFDQRADDAAPGQAVAWLYRGRGAWEVLDVH